MKRVRLKQGYMHNHVNDVKDVKICIDITIVVTVETGGVAVLKQTFIFLKQRSDSMHNSICNFDSLDAFCRRCNGEMHDSTVLFTFHQVAEFNLKIQLNSAK